MNQPTGKLILRVLKADGSVLQEIPLDAPYRHIEVDDEASSLSLEGKGEFFEILTIQK